MPIVSSTPASQATRPQMSGQFFIEQWHTLTPDKVALAGYPLSFHSRSADGKEVFVVHPKMRAITDHRSLASTSVEFKEWADAVRKLTMSPVTLGDRYDIGTDTKTYRAKLKAGLNNPYNNYAQAYGVFLGRLPYATFVDTNTGATWVRVYNPDANIYLIATVDYYKRYYLPEYFPADRNLLDRAFDTLKAVLKKIGKALVKGLVWVWNAIKDLLKWICSKLSSPDGQIAAATANVVAPFVLPGSGPVQVAAGTAAAGAFCALIFPPSSAPSTAPSAAPSAGGQGRGGLILLAVGAGALALILMRR